MNTTRKARLLEKLAIMGAVTTVSAALSGAEKVRAFRQSKAGKTKVRNPLKAKRPGETRWG